MEDQILKIFNEHVAVATRAAGNLTGDVKKICTYCIIHPWAGGLKKEIKQWDNKNWVSLVGKMANDFDNFLITGAPSDVLDSAELFRLIQKTKYASKVFDIAGFFSLSETVDIINNAKAVVCVDTGISHIAAALDKPLVCLQGPADSRRWRPYNDNDHTIVINPQNGVYGYLNYGYEYYKAKGNCMDNILVEVVYQALKKIV